MEWVVESIMDCLKMLPFLFAAFACMEAVEHYSGNKINQMLEKAGHGGPLVGAVLGCIPQCGFSVMASDLYSGGMITLGTLLAVFLATSDEAVLLMLSSPGNGGEILKLMAVKVLIGIVAGYAGDLIFHRRKWAENPMEEICDHCGCRESHGILKPALKHTLQIFVYILVFTLAISYLIEAFGMERLSGMLMGNTLFQPMIAALIGLIPNCAASVTITQLYISGVISLGAMMSGLLVGAGVGLLVLFRVNPDKKKNLKIVGILYVIGVLAGIVINWL